MIAPNEIIDLDHPAPIDLPYACMRTHGVVERVLDRHGRDLPDDWTGLCVTAVSTKDFWMLSARSGTRTALRIGRFNTVAEAMASLRA